MKITILQRGGDKDGHEILEDATRYFGKMLMSTRMCNTLNIRVELRASKLDKDTLGQCSTISMGSKANKDFTVLMQRDVDINKQLMILAHEMVHVAQKATNVLQYRLWKSDRKYHARWNGFDMGLSDSIPYYERPWEREAFALEKHMANAYICHHNKKADKEKQYRASFDKQLKANGRERQSMKEAELAM